MRPRTTGVVVAFALLLSVDVSMADQVLLTDGSIVVGKVTRIAEGKLTIETDFAGTLTIDTSKVDGITTEEPLNVEIDTGDRAVGKLHYQQQGHGQSVVTEVVGHVPVTVNQLTAAWQPGDDSPDVVAHQKALEAARPKWTPRAEFGLDGQTGNSEKVGFNGHLSLLRTTEDDRLDLYARGKYARDNGSRSSNEVIAGAKLEVDLTERTFAFGKTELEFDEFESLDLRATVSGGVGYFFIQEEGHVLKGRVGVGYQHESFDDGTSADKGVGELGIDYTKDLAPWVSYNHSTTVYPGLDRIKDTRIVTENAVEIPLADPSDWALKLGVRNEYDGLPRPGIDRLDTYYFLNMVWTGK